MSKISFIVSAYDRPAMLRCVLAALQVQTEPDIEIIVADNSPHIALNNEHQYVIHQLNDKRFSYRNPRARFCYEAIEQLAPETRGEWLCFPHDDGYYVPVFAQRMLEAAGQDPDAQLVYCDMLYDERMFGHYDVLHSEPRLGAIDKGSFIIRRELFLTRAWPPVPDISRDGIFIEELVRDGALMIHAPGVMFVHN